MKQQLLVLMMVTHHSLISGQCVNGHYLINILWSVCCECNL